MPPALGELLAAARAGDAAGLEALLARCRPWLHLLARMQLGRRFQGKFDASDVVQQALLEAARALPTFRGADEAAYLAWLRGILGNVLGHEERRYAGTQGRDLAREQPLDAGLEASAPRLADLLAASVSSPSAAAQRHEDELRLAAALARLPEDYRTAIVLRNLEGWPHEEVARRLGKSVGAARMLWVRALARLKDELARPTA